MKATLSILFLFALTTAYSQFTKGDKFLSGSITTNGFNRIDENDKSTSVKVSIFRLRLDFF
jgi:hypothetical protein